jgi:ABC-type lipoprotein release transport system permease subunit
MLKLYFKIALRNLLRDKTLSFINISGLTLGMASAALLLLNIQHDLSMDQFHAKKDHIFLAYNKDVINGKLECWNATPPPLATALKEDYPEVKNVARISGAEKLLQYGDKKLKVPGSYTDPSFLNMFSFHLLKGTIQNALSDVHSIVITEDLAKKLFGNEEPMNKIIRADNEDDFIVKGVLKNLPHNTKFQFQYLLPWSFLKLKK